MNEIIDLLTADQLARKLNITVSWIYSHARKKETIRSLILKSENISDFRRVTSGCGCIVNKKI